MTDTFPRLLLDHASASLPDGARVGLLGRNGTGKTTLFKIITGDLSPEGGQISLPRGRRIGGVAQEAPGGPESRSAQLAQLASGQLGRFRLVGCAHAVLR